MGERARRRGVSGGVAREVDEGPEEDDEEEEVGEGRSPARGYSRLYYVQRGAAATQRSRLQLGRTSSASLHDHIAVAFFPAHLDLADYRMAETESQTSPQASPEEEEEEEDNCRVRMPLDSRPLPISLKFVDVSHHITVTERPAPAAASAASRRSYFPKVASVLPRRRAQREILHGVTGHALPGEVMALMGPSGSGKTTLLNLLSGRVSKLGRGTISYNDMPYSKALKRRMGFVMQDDVLYPHLTVKETLTYAALLRLPNHFTKKQKVERALEVIYELGLERCQDIIIGGAFLRGVSGGERKRVCVGHEILIDPSILFLDEPTSGLDSTTALRMIRTLHKICKGGRTIILTIHQPSSRLYYMFDKLILLSEGHMVYFGKATFAIEYFSSIGFCPLITMNPADFLLDLANGNVNDVSIPSQLKAQSKEFYTKKGSDDLSHIRPSSKDIRKYLCTSFQNSLEPMEKHRLLDMGTSSELKGAISIKKESRSMWWSQFVVLFVRGQKQRRHEYLSSLKIFQHMLSSFIIGILWFNSNIRTEKDVTNQVALLFFISAYWSLAPLSIAIQSFPPERAMLAKERASHMYHLSAYFMARTLGDLPLQLCLPTLSILIIYFMAQLRMTAMAFFLTMFTIWLTVVTAQALGIAIGAMIMDLKKAMTLGTTIILIFMLTGGFLVQGFFAAYAKIHIMDKVYCI